jgi:peptide deformylase
MVGVNLGLPEIGNYKCASGQRPTCGGHLHPGYIPIPSTGAEPVVSVLPIVQAGEAVLRAKAARVAVAAIRSAEIQDLIDSMIATMRAAPGVGLAAPQVGKSLRIIVAEDPADAIGRLTPQQRRERGRERAFPLHVCINPRLRRVGDERAIFPEGCLSIPGYAALVERSLNVELSWLDRDGVRHDRTTFTGWPARIFQHEVDHLDGVLYTDRMIARSFMTDEHMKRSTADRSMAAALRELGL